MSKIPQEPVVLSISRRAVNNGKKVELVVKTSVGTFKRVSAKTTTEAKTPRFLVIVSPPTEAMLREQARRRIAEQRRQIAEYQAHIDSGELNQIFYYPGQEPKILNSWAHYIEGCEQEIARVTTGLDAKIAEAAAAEWGYLCWNSRLDLAHKEIAVWAQRWFNTGRAAHIINVEESK